MQRSKERPYSARSWTPRDEVGLDAEVEVGLVLDKAADALDARVGGDERLDEGALDHRIRAERTG